MAPPQDLANFDLVLAYREDWWDQFVTFTNEKGISRRDFVITVKDKDGALISADELPDASCFPIRFTFESKDLYKYFRPDWSLEGLPLPGSNEDDEDEDLGFLLVDWSTQGLPVVLKKSHVVGPRGARKMRHEPRVPVKPKAHLVQRQGEDCVQMLSIAEMLERAPMHKLACRKMCRSDVFSVGKPQMTKRLQQPGGRKASNRAARLL